jgi:dTDP-4-dehydrorhamnose reductase
MTIKLAILGGSGMLGHKMFQRLRLEFPDTVCTIRRCAANDPLNRIDLFRGTDVVRDIDILDFDSVEAFLRSIRPDFIVNCVGIIKQRPDARNSVISISVNSLFPHKIAEMAAQWGGRVIHFSTDCVFSGRRGGYTENDSSDAEDLYGKSKSLGELTAANALTLRTSIIGRELSKHRSLLDWFLSQNHKAIYGYPRVMYSGVTTNHLAELVGTIIREHSGLNGLYQVASEPISKYELLCLLREAYQLDVRIAPDDSVVSDRSMKCDKLREAIQYNCPPWPVLVRQLAEDNTPYGKWLDHK